MDHPVCIFTRLAPRRSGRTLDITKNTTRHNMFGLFKKKKQVDARFSQPLTPEAEKFLAEALEEYQQKKDALERDWHESANVDSELDDAAGVLRVKLADGSGW